MTTIDIHQPHIKGSGPGCGVTFLHAGTHGWIIHSSTILSYDHPQTGYYIHGEDSFVRFFPSERAATQYALDKGLISKARALKVLILCE